MRLGLDRVRAGAEALGSPQDRLRCVQIAGTNGKGTVAAMVAHAARACGLRVGLYTSPHLHRFSERIRIDGEEAGPERLAAPLARAFDLCEGGIGLTLFEVATLAALQVLAEEGVDLAVLEVGLGGRLDATSIADPEVCAVTTIALDHVEILGRDPAAIAREKAAIARAGVPLIAGAIPPEALAAVEAVAAEAGAPVRALGRDFSAPEGLAPPWPGRHQRENAAVALAIVEALGERDGRCTREGLVESLPSLKWPGRWEAIGDSPRILLDGAHNAEAAAALARALAETGEPTAALLFGALEGKPVDAMLSHLAPLAPAVVLARPPIDKAFDPSRHAGRWSAEVAPDVAAGLDRVAEIAGGAGGSALVTGSLFTAGEARRILLGEPTDPQVRL